MLRDAAGFPIRHLGLTNRVQQRRFPMIHVPHNGDDRCARHKHGFGRRLKQIFQESFAFLPVCTSTLSPTPSAISTPASMSMG